MNVNNKNKWVMGAGALAVAVLAAIGAVDPDSLIKLLSDKEVKAPKVEKGNDWFVNTEIPDVEKIPLRDCSLPPLELDWAVVEISYKVELKEDGVSVKNVLELIEISPPTLEVPYRKTDISLEEEKTPRKIFAVYPLNETTVNSYRECLLNLDKATK